MDTKATRNMRKLQPHITPDNAAKKSELPKSLEPVSKFRTIAEIVEALETNKDITVLYVLTEQSSIGKLIPIRGDDKSFLTILMRTD